MIRAGTGCCARRSRQRLLAVGLAAGAVLWAPAASPATEPAIELEIHGTSRPYESDSVLYTARFVRRPVEGSAWGYRPTVAGDESGFQLPTDWEQPVELLWSFAPAGGDAGWISSGERPTVRHRFPQDGPHTIRLRMVDRHGDTVATASKEVTVANSSPGIRYLKAVKVGDADGTIELSAHVLDTPRDTLEYRWDFGDGEEASGTDLWRVRHRFRLEGTYPVTLSVSDGGDEPRSESLEVRVYGSGELPAGAQGGEIDTTSAIVSGLEAEMSGAVSARLKGEIRSVAGLHLAPTNERVCRFMLTAWDPQHLAHVWILLDLDGLPGERGGTYRFSKPRVDLNLEPGAAQYLGRQKLQNTMSHLSLVLAPVAEALPERERAQFERGAGLSPSAEAGYDDRPPAGASPFGLDEHQGFRTVAGELELAFVPHDRAIGTFSVTLTNTRSRPPPGLESLELRGTFALDLGEARQGGLLLYDRCGAGGLGIEKLNPSPGEKHVRLASPFIDVLFDRPIDPETVDEVTFQVGYPAAGSRELELAAGRYFKSARHVVFAPDEPLLDGVRYTARLRTGPDGVRALSGGEIPDEDGAGWRSWQFETALDFELGTGGNLSCHLFQTIREPRLIPNKPAVARVYADWRGHDEVDPSAHVRSFDARVLLWENRQAGSGPQVRHTFVRPDLWDSLGIDTARAAHSANLFGWKPVSGASLPLRLAVQVQRESGGEWTSFLYPTSCPAEMWEREPELAFEYFMMPVGAWSEGNRYADFLPVAADVADAAATFAWQSFPFAEVRQRFGGVIWPRWSPVESSWCEVPIDECRATCDEACVASIYLHQAAGLSSADVVVLFGPLEQFAGGSSQYEVDQAAFGFGIVGMGLDAVAEHRDRLVQGLVHEIGHALGLEHLPTVNATTRARIEAVRNAGWAGGEPLWWKGIEAFRLARDGTLGWNKSSSEGNEQSSWLVPLMIPVSVPQDAAMIARQQYLKLQDRLAEPGSRWAFLPPAAGPRLASLAPLALAEEPAGSGPGAGAVGLAGVLAADGHVAVLGPLVDAGGRGWRPQRADLELVLLDAGGSEIGRGVGSFEPSRGASPGRPFRAFAPGHPAAVRLELRRDGKLLAARNRSPHSPMANLTLGERRGGRGDAGGVAASWEVSDADGDPLAVSLLFSPDGLGQWTVLGAGLEPRGELEVDAARLRSGDRPTLRLVVSDGFRRAEDLVSVGR